MRATWTSNLIRVGAYVSGIAGAFAMVGSRKPGAHHAWLAPLGAGLLVLMMVLFVTAFTLQLIARFQRPLGLRTPREKPGSTPAERADAKNTETRR